MASPLDSSYVSDGLKAKDYGTRKNYRKRLAANPQRSLNGDSGVTNLFVRFNTSDAQEYRSNSTNTNEPSLREGSVSLRDLIPHENIVPRTAGENALSGVAQRHQ